MISDLSLMQAPVATSSYSDECAKNAAELADKLVEYRYGDLRWAVASAKSGSLTTEAQECYEAAYGYFLKMISPD